MKATLFLSGGGVGEQSKDIDTEFINVLPNNPKIVLIPLARQKEKIEKTSNWFKEAYYKYGIVNIEILHHDETQLDKLLESDGIYISGGNTYRLLDNLRKIKGIDFLKKISDKNIPIYGGSAGAVLLGKDIDTSNDENAEQLVDTSGLNFMHNTSIMVHYTPNLEISAKKMSFERNIITIPENGGIIVYSNNSYKVVGNDCILFIKGNEIILKKGESYEF